MTPLEVQEGITFAGVVIRLILQVFAFLKKFFMKLQRTTLILILLALGLSIFVYLYEIKGAQQREAAKAKEGQIFSFEEEQIQSFTITNPQQTLKIERVNQKTRDNSQLSQWQIKAPTDASASDASVSYLLNLLVKGKSDRSFSILPSQLQEYGLDKPLATIEVKLKNQQNHQLILGKHNYNNNSLYAQADPSNKKTQKLQVLLVPISFEYAVKRPLAEWKATSSPSPTLPNTPVLPLPSQVTPSASPNQSGKPALPKPSQVTPSASPNQSGKPALPKPSQVTPSASPNQSGKPVPPTPSQVTPSPSATPSSKSVPPTPSQVTPSPSR